MNSKLLRIILASAGISSLSAETPELPVPMGNPASSYTMENGLHKMIHTFPDKDAKTYNGLRATSTIYYSSSDMMGIHNLDVFVKKGLIMVYDSINNVIVKTLSEKDIQNEYDEMQEFIMFNSENGISYNLDFTLPLPMGNPVLTYTDENGKEREKHTFPSELYTLAPELNATVNMKDGEIERRLDTYAGVERPHFIVFDNLANVIVETFDKIDFDPGFSRIHLKEEAHGDLLVYTFNKDGVNYSIEK